MLFQKKAEFTLTAPKESKSGYKHILIGEEYGRLTVRK
jgi:phosphatidylserine decarboxylase